MSDILMGTTASFQKDSWVLMVPPGFPECCREASSSLTGWTVSTPASPKVAPLLSIHLLGTGCILFDRGLTLPKWGKNGKPLD